MSQPDPIEVLLKEGRHFSPPPEFSRRAVVADESLYEQAERDPEAFWARCASELEWIEPWTRVLDWQPPRARWFLGGQLNASVNCLDRHLATRRNKAALIWEGEPGEERILTYHDLWREVGKAGNMLRQLGVRRGDRVTLYMPLIPELVIAMLACARIGAVHSVVFAGFSAEALRDRINDQQARLVITADGGYRRGNLVPLKRTVDEALRHCPSVTDVILYKRGDFPIHVQEGRDHWWHRLMADMSAVCPPEPMDSEDMLYVLYTSGTTGRPKGIVHTTGGYLTGVHATTRWVFDLQENDRYWCTADVGWVTGHSYVVYGPLSNGATVFLYEGAPDWPDKDRFWALIEKYGISVFYTAPTAIRAFMRWGPEFVERHDLSSLRLLGSVGEPINPEAWVWYHHHVGGGRCPVVDTWWQTETGMIMISPLPGVTTCKPGSATRPLPGIAATVLDERGGTVEVGGGYLAITRPWPAMLRGIYGDPERYREQYWSRWGNGIYFPGDGAHRDEDGYFWLMGRVDDVMNVAGHRIGTAEVESALVDHHCVAEAAVIGRAHELKGQAIVAFVTLKDGCLPGGELADELKAHVTKRIGALARPEELLFAGDLPKTRSGKIMRRLLKDIAEGRVMGDTTTLADPGVVAALKEKYEEEG
ncbi:MAG TPA: acetate--CoA ligase [Candidatus Saccharimonadales bacterium]|nr:acetate--CoA ligase [Candidatus Saccharimonadales bacterium]